MSTTEVRDLNVLAIYVSDLNRSKSFYGGHLGFVPGEEMPPGSLMSAGNVTLYIEAGQAQKHGGEPAMSGFSPCFATDSVRASHDALEAAGVRIVTVYQELSPEFAFFRISDPDGNLIEFAGKT